MAPLSDGTPGHTMASIPTTANTPAFAELFESFPLAAHRRRHDPRGPPPAWGPGHSTTLYEGSGRKPLPAADAGVALVASAQLARTVTKRRKHNLYFRFGARPESCRETPKARYFRFWHAAMEATRAAARTNVAFTHGIGPPCRAGMDANETARGAPYELAVCWCALSEPAPTPRDHDPRAPGP